MSPTAPISAPSLSSISLLLPSLPTSTSFISLSPRSSSPRHLHLHRQVVPSHLHVPLHSPPHDLTTSPYLVSTLPRRLVVRRHLCVEFLLCHLFVSDHLVTQRCSLSGRGCLDLGERAWTETSSPQTVTQLAALPPPPPSHTLSSCPRFVDLCLAFVQHLLVQLRRLLSLSLLHLSPAASSNAWFLLPSASIPTVSSVLLSTATSSPSFPCVSPSCVASSIFGKPRTAFSSWPTCLPMTSRVPNSSNRTRH
mmetsp:Transcript_10621/g.24867  ORF Transcript_10621/g.24867 Transcript_10621/m.24867 type:complete len:251 (+) Transcript_10621:1036-1788(+)